MIFNVGAGESKAEKIKYGDSNVGATLDNLNESVDELDKSVDELNNSLSMKVYPSNGGATTLSDIYAKIAELRNSYIEDNKTDKMNFLVLKASSGGVYTVWSYNGTDTFFSSTYVLGSLFTVNSISKAKGHEKWTMNSSSSITTSTVTDTKYRLYYYE